MPTDGTITQLVWGRSKGLTVGAGGGGGTTRAGAGGGGGGGGWGRSLATATGGAALAAIGSWSCSVAAAWEAVSSPALARPVLATMPPTASVVIIAGTTVLLRVRLMKFDATCAPFGLVGASDWAPGEHTHSREALIHRVGLRHGRGRSYLKAAVSLSPRGVVLRPGTGRPRVRGVSRKHSLSRITTTCTTGVSE